MPKHNKPREGSLQFWPRKRIRKFLPSVNWKAIKSDSKMRGFIAYKVGMGSVLVKDTSPDSMTKDKKIIVPVSILELPPVKIFSVRFYKNNQVSQEVLVAEDKELKRIVKLGKKGNIDSAKDYDDIRIIVYSLAKNTGIKKTPDIAEIALSGSLDEKLKFAKEKIGKEIFASEILKIGIIDIRGLTKGKGLQGPVKRFGVKLKQHKSEKGRRRPGSLGPWHPAHTLFRSAMAGQLGLFTRIQYNSRLIKIGKANEIEKKEGWKNYGNIKTEYAIISGSVPGPAKRELLLTSSLRPSKSQEKKKYEFIKLVER